MPLVSENDTDTDFISWKQAPPGSSPWIGRRGSCSEVNLMFNFEAWGEAAVTDASLTSHREPWLVDYFGFFTPDMKIVSNLLASLGPARQEPDLVSIPT